MKRIELIITLFITIFTITSCDTTSNYLTQNYVPPSTTTNQSNLKKLKTVLKKPIIMPENIDLVDEQNEVLEKFESSIFVSSLEMTVNNIIYEANSYLGTPYRYGGTTRRGIDCSAFMQKIYHVEGINLPRVSYNQARVGIPVPKDELQKGDLIFFSTTSPTRITHVGMVVNVEDDVEFIHASSSQGVSIASLSNSYWKRKYRSARRPKQFLNDSLISVEEVEKMVAIN
ncbi:hydrolase Nlp/P60 [Flavobacteriaceae bacterium Ap0902]|nr:hydrolase Nlp/P60 [Flavobacteriaceae bacterium Ap0902]